MGRLRALGRMVKAPWNWTELRALSDRESVLSFERFN